MTAGSPHSATHRRSVLVLHIGFGPASGALLDCDRTVRVGGHDVPTGGDVIAGVGGERVDAHEELMRYLLLETRPGEPVEMSLVRDGERLEATVTLGERPRSTCRAAVG